MTSDLLHVFEQFLSDVESVRVGVLKGLAKFLGVLEPGIRESYLHTLTDIFENSSQLNWRMRYIVALQLPSLILLFSSTSIRTSLLPLIINLISDPVSEVRTAAFHAVASLLDKDDKKITTEIAKAMKDLAGSETYTDRVAFCGVCIVLVGPKAEGGMGPGAKVEVEGGGDEAATVKEEEGGREGGEGGEVIDAEAEAKR